MIYDEYRGKDFVDLGETITIPMNIIVSQNNVFNYLKKFGDQNWAKINFKFSRIGAVKDYNYDFSFKETIRK